VHKVFPLGRFALDSGADLPDAHLAYATYGTLDSDGGNCVLLPSYYTGTHHSYAPWIGPGRALDPERWFIVAVNMFGNGLSTSPSNAHPTIRGARFPAVSISDNVRAQHRLLTHLGVHRIRMVAGWSMGALQAYEWAVRYPDLVGSVLPICGAARCSPHNYIFLEGVKAALTADPVFNAGRYTAPPVAGLRAFGTVYAGWAYSQAFFRNRTYTELGYGSTADLLEDWAADHAARDANDLLAMLHTWQQADPGLCPAGNEDGLAPVLAAVTARSIVMPSTTDLYFTLEDNALEAGLLPNAELRPIDSDLGHIAGRPGIRDRETNIITAAMHDLLEDRPW